jgi:hypothetical protein
LQEIHNGTTEYIELTIFKDGVRATPDGAVNVSLYDVSTFNADPTAILLTASATPPSDPLGAYLYQVGPSITYLNRTIRADWSYALSSASTTQSTFFNVVTPYATVSDIIDYYNLGTKPSDLNYKSSEQIVQLEKLARTVIHGYAGQQFGRRAGSQEVFGIGSDACFLTEPMTAITKMYENDILVYDTTASPVMNQFGFDLTLTPTGKTVRIINAGWDVRYDNNIDPSILYYGRFRNSSRYKFEGTIGWNYVPTDISLASLLLVGDLMANDAAWRIKYLEEVTMGEVKFKMKSGAFNGTGNLIVDNILDQYRNVGIVII